MFLFYLSFWCWTTFDHFLTQLSYRALHIIARGMNTLLTTETANFGWFPFLVTQVNNSVLITRLRRS